MQVKQVEWHHVFHSMGIPVHLTLLDISKDAAKKVAKEVENIFIAWDKRASRFREDSELMHIIRSAGNWVKVSPELFSVLDKSLELSRKTKGLFDISVGAYLAAASYGLPKDYKLPKDVPHFQSIELDTQNFSVKIAKGQVIEPAALVKAIAIDEAGQLLKKNSEHWMINAGGDVLTHGLFHGKKWRVGIQDPRDEQKILDLIEIHDAALATSGSYVVKKKLNGKAWHHEINPKTGQPTNSILSLSVIAPSAYRADIISTIAFLHDSEVESYLRKRIEPFFLVTSDLQTILGNGWQSYSLM